MRKESLWRGDVGGEVGRLCVWDEYLGRDILLCSLGSV